MTALHFRNTTVLALTLVLLTGCGGGDSPNGTDDESLTVDDGVVGTNPGSVAAPTASVVNTPASARHKNPTLVFNASGAGLAVWETDSETGLKILWSVYDPAAGSWSSEAVLRAVADIDGFSSFKIKAAASADGFAVAWVEPQGVNEVSDLYATVYQNGSWSASQRIDEVDAYSVSRHAIASNSSAYMLAWEQRDTSGYPRFLASSFAGGSWSAAQHAYDASEISASLVGLISDGSGYLLTLTEGVSDDSSVAVVYSGGSWGAPTPFVGPSGESTRIVTSASNGGGYMVVWRQPATSTDLYYRLYSGSAWADAAPLVTGAVEYPRLASDGSGYALVYTGPGYDEIAYGMTYTSGAWSAAQPIESLTGLIASLSLTSNGSGYAAIFRQGGDIYAATYSDNAWSGETLIDAGDEAADFPAIAAAGSDYLAAWIQYDGAATEALYLRRLGGSGLGPITGLLHEGHDSSAHYPALAANASGQHMAVWRQNYFDPTASEVQYQYKSGLFQSLNDSGSWSTAQLIEKYGVSPTVVSNGASFLVTWYSVSAPGGSLRASVFTNGVRGETLSLDGSVYDSMAVAGDNGYVITWESNHSGDWGVYAITYDELTGWSATTRLDDTANPNSAHQPKAASDGTTYAVTWLQSTVEGTAAGYSGYASVYSDGSWQRSLVENDDVGSVSGITMTASQNGYLAAFMLIQPDSTSGIYANVYSGGWNGMAQISASGTLPQLASNGTGYMAAWEDYPNIKANIFRDNAWQGESDIATTEYSAGINGLASNGAGYLLTWSVADLHYPNYALRHNGTAWETAPTFLAQDVRRLRLASAGTDYAAVWSSSSDEGWEGDLSYRLFDGLSWGEVSRLESGSVQVYEFDLTVAGSKYAAVWTQAHAGYYDPAARKVWHQVFPE